MPLIMENDGQAILSTNYFSTDHAKKGFFFLSLNAGAFRLLVPATNVSMVDDMRTAKQIVISRGPYPEWRETDAIELLFDDHSDNPFSIHLVGKQVDRWAKKEDSGKQFVFAAWIDGPQCVFESSCYYRVVPRLPYLKPWPLAAPATQTGKESLLNPQQVIQQVLAGYLVPGKKYHSELPAPLQAWYCYTSDGGHSILCVLKKDFQPARDLTQYLVPAPVKSVLRGYTINNGYVVVDLGYDQNIGLLVPDGDDEY